MAQKAGINACLRLVFVALVVSALTQSSCIKEAREDVKQSKGRKLIGGYIEVENPEKDVDVQGIVNSSLKQYNEQSNDLQEFGLFENGTIEAYTQLVHGQNYCVQFTLVSVGCKKCLNNRRCRTGKKIICSVKAYKALKTHKALKEEEAHIDPETVACVRPRHKISNMTVT